jgi:hypothetical protein
MSLPLSNHSKYIQDKFNTTYDGYPTAIFKTSVEYHNFTTMLSEAKASFRTKINKHKKRGREFLVMLVETANAS